MYNNAQIAATRFGCTVPIIRLYISQVEKEIVARVAFAFTAGHLLVADSSPWIPAL
jgi:hypothetical protein